MCKLLMWMQQADPITLHNNLVGPNVSHIALIRGLQEGDAQVGIMLISRQWADLQWTLIFSEKQQ